ncbi:hypothetical protein OESDEN_03964 [Oesophagostomum dentatum]|uniref:Uncharacterized protein n=1 Tax=Oesophagostomum dentatum TaxID=61180 RepID=A0A0B1TL06_OESDE|nr:hypothetical protein OESDEN_03964 [Oesophagostomum dentatum]
MIRSDPYNFVAKFFAVDHHKIDNSTLFMLGEFASTQLQLHLDSHNVTTKCESIKLLRTEAKQYVTVLPNVTHVSISPAIVYDVTFEVSPPAKGKFLIPVRKEGEHLQLAGEVFSRLDRYGKGGDCMKKDVLKPLCTCK